MDSVTRMHEFLKLTGVPAILGKRTGHTTAEAMCEGDDYLVIEVTDYGEWSYTLRGDITDDQEGLTLRGVLSRAPWENVSTVPPFWLREGFVYYGGPDGL